MVFLPPVHLFSLKVRRPEGPPLPRTQSLDGSDDRGPGVSPPFAFSLNFPVPPKSKNPLACLGTCVRSPHSRFVGSYKLQDPPQFPFVNASFPLFSPFFYFRFLFSLFF